LAHVYVEQVRFRFRIYFGGLKFVVVLWQGHYVNAIKLYENCLKRPECQQFVLCCVFCLILKSHLLYIHRNPQVYTYLARVQFLNGAFGACQRALAHALHLTPGDNLVRFNIALAQQHAAAAALRKTSEMSLADVR
jgi:hypothetical protein